MSERVEDPENPGEWLLECECGNMDYTDETHCGYCGEPHHEGGPNDPQHKVYVPRKFKADTMDMIHKAVEIIAEYERQDYKITLRQLYYQFVSRGLIPNRQAEYDKLGTTVTNARLAGLISFGAIEDRNRVPEIPYIQESHQRIADNTRHHFNVDMWKRQPRRVEVWVEKDALSGVIERACRGRRVPYLACKGYMSSSAMWGSAQRALAAYEKNDQETLIIHLGDHDPSGIDMTRDNQDRMDLLSDSAGLVTVTRIALNMDQVEEHRPPPNPTKLTDSRARDYLREHGRESWELDALEPSIIEGLITARVRREIDDAQWAEDAGREEAGVAVWRSLGRNWNDVRKLLEEIDNV